MSITENIHKIKETLPEDVTLVAVSKTKPETMIMEAFNAGHLDFGENKVQELTTKYENLPKTIHWHFIGHLQSNKVKYIAPFVHLIHAVDSIKLLQVIEKEAEKNNRTINCLLQIKISPEESKFGLAVDDAALLLESTEFSNLKRVQITGLMGMASYVENASIISDEFAYLKKQFELFKASYFYDEPGFSTLSMGMSGDYLLALKQGSNMIRIGSSIFGERQYP